jgi:plastocyanin
MRRILHRAGTALAVVGLTVGLSACGGGGGGDDGGSAYKPPAGPSTETISIDAGNFYFKPDKVTAKPGIATIELTSQGGSHDLVFDGAYSGFQVEVSGEGDHAAEKIDLKAGTYTFYCSFPGHRAAGMQGTLTVK